jgi:Spy/CpxP family protein refolding chaperone
MLRSSFRARPVALLLLVAFAASALMGQSKIDAQTSTPSAHDGGHGGHGGHGGSTTETTAPATTDSPYAAGFDPEATIRSLTPDEIAQIERGEGAGFALPAEVNGVPGPRHVLDLAADLNLTPEQVERVQAIADEMRAEVIPAGRRYLDAVEALEADFRAGTLTEAELPDRVAEVARLEGELAAAHLVAHLQTAAVLSPEQIATYNRLRGYR